MFVCFSCCFMCFLFWSLFLFVFFCRCFCFVFHVFCFVLFCLFYYPTHQCLFTQIASRHANIANWLMAPLQKKSSVGKISAVKLCYLLSMLLARNFTLMDSQWEKMLFPLEWRIWLALSCYPAKTTTTNLPVTITTIFRLATKKKKKHTLV